MTAPLVAAALTLLAACGADTETVAPPSPATTAAPASSPGAYTPSSDVTAHAAIGQDVAKIKALLEVAKTAKPIDWPAVSELFEKGGASRKSDGTNRTLATLVPTSPTTKAVRDAATGTGPSAGAADPVRAQRVDKGITVLLSEKVMQELDAAATKTKAGQVTKDTGAPHNVDEAWAFFTADGQGPAATADKRAADFNKTGTVKEPILAALVRAQTAASAGDTAALDSATTATRKSLDYVFYLATYKYLAAKDDTGRAEGAAFYRGIQPRVTQADPTADAAITAAFATGDATAGRTAINSSTVLTALGITDEQKVST